MFGRKLKGKTEEEQKQERIQEREWIEAVRNGDPFSYSHLVKAHQRGLLRLCIRFMKDVGLAEDVVQESFLKAYEKLGTFEGRSSFKSWLYQIAVNTAKNRLRDRRETPVEIEEWDGRQESEVENQLHRQKVSQWLQQKIEKLPCKQRMALELRVYDDLSFQEIAEIMDCPYDTAKANYRHAYLKMKKAFLSDHQSEFMWTQQPEPKVEK